MSNDKNNQMNEWLRDSTSRTNFAPVTDEEIMPMLRNPANHFNREGWKEAVEWFLRESDLGSGADVLTLKPKRVRCIDSSKLDELKKELDKTTS